MDEQMWDTLNRKVSVLDIDIAEQEVILRTDIDVALSPYVPLPPIEEEFKAFFDAQKAEESQSSRSKKKKKNKKQLEEEAEQLQLLEQAKRMRAEPWKQRQILDHRLIKRTATSIKYLQEHLAKRVIILGSLGEKAGRANLENSVRLLVSPIQHQVQDIPVAYLDHGVLGNAERLEELKENCVYVLENLNFLPDEHSYVEPWVEPAEKPVEEVKKTEPNEEDSQNMQKKLAKMSAAEKKKFAEEESKRKAEEDSKAQEASAASQAEQAKEAAERKKKEAERQKRLQEEHFDSKTTYRYLKNLGAPLGSIYINDSPLGCLTTSNSIAETKVGRKVMGVKMTEDLRKLAQFFLKKFPLDVNLRHVKKPEQKPYFASKFSAVLGGQCRNVGDIMDKILLANSLLDHASQIFLVGEIGLAAVYSLGFDISRVERCDSLDKQKADYSQVKDFFLKLFEKASERGVSIIPPLDFIVSPHFDPSKTG